MKHRTRHLTDNYRQTLIKHLQKHGYKVIVPKDIGSILQREPIRFENSDVTIVMFGSRYDVRWGGRSGTLHAAVCKTFTEVRTRLDRLFKEEEIKKHDFEQERHRFEPFVEQLRTVEWLKDADLRLNLRPTDRNVFPEIELCVPGINDPAGWIHFNLDLSVETFVFGHEVWSKIDFAEVRRLLKSEAVFDKLDRHIDPIEYGDGIFYALDRPLRLRNVLPYLLYMKATNVRRIMLTTNRRVEGQVNEGNLINMPSDADKRVAQQLLNKVEEHKVITGLCDTTRIRKRIVEEDNDDF